MHLIEERQTVEDPADTLGDAVVALERAYRHALRHPVASALPALELALLLAEAVATRRQWLHDALAQRTENDVRATTGLIRALADELEHRAVAHGTAP